MYFNRLWRKFVRYWSLDQLTPGRFSPEVMVELRRERAAQAVANTPAMAICNITFTCIIGFWFLGRGIDLAISIWMAVSVGFYGYGLYRFLNRDQSRPISGSRRGINRIVVQSMVVATLFCSASFILIPVARGHDAAIIAGMAASVLVIGPYVVYSIPRASLAWLATCTTLNTVSFMGLGETPFVISGIFGIVIALGVARASITQSNRLTAQFELRQQAIADREALQEQQETIALLLKEYETKSGSWLWECDADGNFTRLPDGLKDALAIENPGDKSANLRDFVGNFDSGSSTGLEEQILGLFSKPATFGEIHCPVRADNDNVGWVAVRGQPRFQEDGTFIGYRGIATDITEKKAADDHIRFLATHDSLTGLPNRISYADTISPWVVQKRPFASLHIDLDRFKLVNDTMGHLAGDELLRKVGERLSQATGEAHPEAHCARMGGDEFVAAIPLDTAGQDGALDDQPARDLARLIVEQLSEPFELDEGVARIGGSVGFAIFPEDGEDTPQLSARADLALYRAKEQGRNTSRRYAEDMDRRSQDRKRLEAELKTALENSEFHLEYQPLVDLADGKVSGVEALLRWKHPEFGLVAPDIFIPIAEETGAITAIGSWVLRTACEEAMRWSRPLTIAVNVSAHQILRKNFVPLVRDVLDKTGLSPSRLEIELTESILIEDANTTFKVINQLRELGISIVLDDFGTGYSSLSYLRDFAFDKIKIDRSFVSAMEEEAQAGADAPATLVTAIVNLANTLGMHTTAEGIEMDHQAENLRAIGCNTGQGYLFSRPVSNRELHAVCSLLPKFVDEAAA